MGFKFQAKDIPGVIYVTTDIYEDDRGNFSEVYKEPLFKENGIDVDFLQANQSLSKKGVLRGLHFQKNPKAQAKLVRAVVGEIFDVAVDIRVGSPTFGKWVGVRLSAQRRDMLFLPAGFAHGFYVLSDMAEVLYYSSNVYSPDCESGIIYDDPQIAVNWPQGERILSKKDAELLNLVQADNNFIYEN